MRVTLFLAYALASLSSVTADEKGTADICCNALNEDALLKNKVLLPDTYLYQVRLETYYDTAATLQSWCMVTPKSTEDASHVMKTLSEHNCPFGIKSGGHGTFKLSNAVQDGVTIDMGYMNATTYDAERGIVGAQPAAKSANAYQNLEPYGVTVTGGRCGPVGLGGFVSGGGVSYHASEHGMGCDNVVNFELVLGNGTVINANENENSDLWVAMRGGSGNFGLITRLDMKAIKFPDPEVPHIFSGIIGWDLSKAQEVVDAFIEFAENIPNDPASSANLWWHWSRLDGMKLQNTPANTKNDPKAPGLAKFLAIDNVVKNTLRSATMYNITMEIAGDDHNYNIWYPSAFYSDERIIWYAQEKHEELVKTLNETIPAGNLLSTQAQFQPLTKTMVAHSKGNNIAGLEKYVEKGTGMLFLISCVVSTPEDHEVALDLVRAYSEDINRYADSLGQNWHWIYLDYANGEQDPIAAFGQENIAKMKNASLKYDPQQVFQKLRGSGFKLPA